MGHRINGRKLGRATDHRLAMFRNLVTDLLKYEKIITTEAKAKEMRGFAERMITLGKKGDLPARRRALGFVYDKARDSSDLVILDATNPAAEPVASIHLPQRVPHGFHGSWIRD